jgi:DNA-binding XRE family transcriptional regulator
MAQHFQDIDKVDDFKSAQITMTINGETDVWDKIMTDRAYLYYRRKELGLTQQQVADRAGIKLIQYQRFERGERSMASASFRIGMAICDVLKLDPHRFTGFAD